MPVNPALQRGLRIALSVFVCTLCSCAGTRKLLKAKERPATAFLDIHAGNLRADPPGSGPFHKVWRTTSPALIRSAMQKPAIVVAPVNLHWLQQTGATMARFDESRMGRPRPVAHITRELRVRFREALARYGPPGKGRTLVLELALTEFTPTSISGNVLKTAAGLVIGPVSAVAGPWVKGTIAIEGRLRDPATGAIVYQFADRESDPITWISVRNFQGTAFTENIIRQWAAQFASAVRTPAGIQIPDAPVIRLNPF